MSEDDIVIHNVTVDICEVCLGGAEGECHVPGCIFFWCPAVTAEQAKRLQRASDSKVYVRNGNVLNAANLEGLSWKARAEQNYAEWEEANKKIGRLEEDVRQYRAMAEAAERERWVDANDYAILKQRVYKLLEQTIEVLEEAGGVIWQHRPELWAEEAKPLLDNLKALKKEGTE